VKQRRLLVIGTRSLFGTGVMTLLERQMDHVTIDTAPDLKSAVEKPCAAAPDVIVYFKEKHVPEEQAVLQELGARYRARIISCTLEADQLTIYDQTKINHATVDDLMAAVLK
jgi:hypothetical protein